MENINLSQFPGVIDYHITPDGNIYISSIVGGCTENKPDGTPYKENELLQALQSRVNTIKRLYDNYRKSI